VGELAGRDLAIDAGELPRSNEVQQAGEAGLFIGPLDLLPTGRS